MIEQKGLFNTVTPSEIPLLINVRATLADPSPTTKPSVYLFGEVMINGRFKDSLLGSHEPDSFIQSLAKIME